MSRDWDKLKRQDRARKSPIYYQFSRRARHKTRRTARKLFGKADIAARSAKRPLPTIERLMEVEMAGSLTQVTWKRTRGVWRVIAASGPLEWWLRVSHPDTIYDWLRTHAVSYRWLPKSLPAPAPIKGAKEPPAEAHTPNQASVPSGNNTRPCKIQKQPGTTLITAPGPALEGNGVTTSSPFNVRRVSSEILLRNPAQVPATSHRQPFRSLAKHAFRRPPPAGPGAPPDR